MSKESGDGGFTFEDERENGNDNRSNNKNRLKDFLKDTGNILSDAVKSVKKYVCDLFNTQNEKGEKFKLESSLYESSPCFLSLDGVSDQKQQEKQINFYCHRNHIYQYPEFNFSVADNRLFKKDAEFIFLVFTFIFICLIAIYFFVYLYVDFFNQERSEKVSYAVNDYKKTFRQNKKIANVFLYSGFTAFVASLVLLTVIVFRKID